MRDTAYEEIKDPNEHVLEQLAEAQMDQDERELAARSPVDDDTSRSPEDDDANDKESRPPTNPYNWDNYMDGCINYPSLGSIRVSTTRMP